MIPFIARRLAWTALVLYVVVSATFALAYLLPADPARMIAGPHASPEVVLIGRNVRYYEDLIFQALSAARVPAADADAPVGG